MKNSAKAVTRADLLALPAMQLLASLNLLFFGSFLIIFCMALAH